MKKTAVLIFTLCLVFFCTCVGTAGELSWADVEPLLTGAGWEGSFVTFDEISLKMYVPHALSAVELTDEDRKAGYIAYFTTEDESAAVGVQYVNAAGMDLSFYRERLVANGIADARDGVINGLPALSYSYANEDGVTTTVLSLATQMGNLLEFAFVPTNDEGFGALAQVMAASIQTAD